MTDNAVLWQARNNDGCLLQIIQKGNTLLCKFMETEKENPPGWEITEERAQEMISSLKERQSFAPNKWVARISEPFWVTITIQQVWKEQCIFTYDIGFFIFGETQYFILTNEEIESFLSIVSKAIPQMDIAS